MNSYLVLYLLCVVLGGSMWEFFTTCNCRSPKPPPPARRQMGKK